MKTTKTIATLSIIVVLGFCVSFAQQGAQGSDAAGQTDAIFQDILQSLPVQQRAQVDSAKSARDAAGSADEAGVREMTAQSVQSRERALEQLPDDVRSQVEKAIDNIEAGASHRQAQFKEQKQLQTGRK